MKNDSKHSLEQNDQLKRGKSPYENWSGQKDAGIELAIIKCEEIYESLGLEAPRLSIMALVWSLCKIFRAAVI
jgi:hypothetical protein